MADQSSVTPRHFEIEWGGRTLSIDIAKYAGQANGSCVLQYGDTVVLVTAVLSASAREGISYFPLMVDYEERLYAAGKIKGSRFIKREGRPTDEAILSGRLIDRAIRPFFPDGIRNDVQVVCTTMSWDQENDPDVLGLVGASIALSVSEIPWDGPIAGIRVGRIASTDGTRHEWVINPTYAAREKGELDLIVAGDGERIIMLEAGGTQVSEDAFVDAAAFGLKHLRPIVQLIREIQSTCGAKKWVPTPPALTEDDQAIEKRVREFLRTRIHDGLRAGTRNRKRERKAFVGELLLALDAFLTAEQVGKDKRKRLTDLVDPLVEEGTVQLILEDNRRVDGRRLDEVRPLEVAVGVLPRTHGSGYFCRGETHVMSTVTLGSPSKEQILDSMEFADAKKRYMHHYNFPAFSVGETGPNRGPGRREIGHGALAERALETVIPSKESFPYTIRVVSETLSSNGSSSMASTCGSTLALMDAGVPIAAPIAGLAMGIASDASGRWKIITDIQDFEDGKGGMDFKIAGSRTGITAVQMDTKTKGLTMEMVRATVDQARAARLVILDAMAAVIRESRAELSKYAPRVQTIQISPDRIRDVIGPGGKIINEIIAKTGAEIDIEQSGLIFITSVSKDGMDRAVDWIRQLTREVKAGEIFRGRVTRLLNFGAFVEILPKQEGLVHISELAPYHVAEVSDIVKIGDEVPVMVKEIDDLGRINLSLKAAVAAGEAFEYPPAPPDGGGFDGGGTRGHGHGPSGFRGGPPSGGRGGPHRGPPRFGGSRR
ncbi:MAG: polyribonucleotide nucleotidyltransferase [bacterium]|nr:polyribonucleotide nucleotidyltransferase [bacterium]